MIKRILLFTGFIFLTLLASAQMSDEQVKQFVESEMKAGTSQSQIVTKLMQRGVTVEQARRLRNQYDMQISEQDLTKAADGTTSQEVTTDKRVVSGELRSDGSEEMSMMENSEQATQKVPRTPDGKKVFGRDIFSQANPNFQPNVNLAVPPTYILGPGDQLIIDIYGASQQTIIQTISPEGTITVEGYGPVYLNGFSLAAAKKKLRSTVGSRFQSSNIQVSVGNTRSIQVNIMGEVSRPGSYRISAFANVFYALYQAGGTSSLGTLRNIKVYRDEELVAVIDLYDYILNGRMTGNVNLQDNDIIQVGVYDRLVSITGKVRRPMSYEMRENETLETLIKYAGDFTGDANRKTVRLVRQSGERHQVYNIDESELKNFRLEDGDAVTVDGMINRFENMVEIKGAVFRPGLFRLDSNLTTVRGLIEAADGLTEDAFTSRAVLHRLKEDRSLLTIPVDIRGIMDGRVADIRLQNEDVLFIPTETELRTKRTFTITGEVMSPGTYEYADNTTIEDLIVLAGGLTDMASMGKVDVSRRIRDPKATQKSNRIAESFTFSLKDGLVIDGEPGFVLQPYDVVHVRRSPAYSIARNITVTGEVNYEGSFTLEGKDMRLSDAIAMAGGLTENAYLAGARLSRQLTEEERVREQATMDAISDLIRERDSIAWSKMDVGKNYYVGIDLEGAMKKPGSDKDIILREGDQIFIPEYNGIVKVAGNVMFPNTVFFQAGKNCKKYINMAGGYGHRPKRSKVFIVYQNGTVGLASQGAKPEPGCEIVVPTKKQKPQSTFNLATLATSIASLATMTTAIVSMVTLLKK